VVGSYSGGRFGDPNRDGIEDWFFSFNHFFTLALFFVLGRFVDLDVLETNVYRRNANLEIPVRNFTI